MNSRSDIYLDRATNTWMRRTENGPRPLDPTNPADVRDFALVGRVMSGNPIVPTKA